MKAACIRRASTQNPEHGYVLLVLLLMISLMAIASVVALTPIKAQIERDREDELIHRGVQYTRAIRRYTRKFGRYPASLDDLQSSNNQRFLRKKYKDPITGKDFKLLHFADVQLSNGPGVAAYTIGSQPPGTPNAPDTGQPTGNSAPSSDSADPAANSNSQTSNATPDSAQNGAFGQSGSPFARGGATPLQGNGLQSGSSSPFSAGTSASQFGGGVILGVASTSKKEGFHEFGHKSHYNDWKFYFDPGFDRGFPITGPTVAPTIPAGGMGGAPAGANAANNAAVPQAAQPQDPNPPLAQPQ